MTSRQVVLEGGPPWGFRMHGGVDVKVPLQISRVNSGSKAASRGIRESDLITSINGKSTKNLTNVEAHNLLRSSGSTLKLGINEDGQGSLNKRHYKTVHQETTEETIKRSSLKTYTLQETKDITKNSSSKAEKFNEEEALQYSKEFHEYSETSNQKNGRLNKSPITSNSTSSSTSTPSTLRASEGNRQSSPDCAIASRQSSYSNCSSFTDEGTNGVSYQTDTEDIRMNDEASCMSRSKKRRLRRKNSLKGANNATAKNETKVEIEEIIEANNEVEEQKTVDNVVGNNRVPSENIRSDKEFDERNYANLKEELSRDTSIITNNELGLENNKISEEKPTKLFKEEYKVESPKELKFENVKVIERRLKAKSKSLDDEDFFKISELSDNSESEGKKVNESRGIISEASSEENLLEDVTQSTNLSSIPLTLTNNSGSITKSLISPEEEKELRNFLGGLNLVNSPELSAKEVYEKAHSQNEAKARKIQQRIELEQYFLPICENPRFLDAISEEASDISDKESSNDAQHLKQGTPDLDLPQKYDEQKPPTQKVPEAPTRRSRSRVLEKMCNQIKQEPAKLVETRIIEGANIQDTVCSTQIAPEAVSNVEVVFINDSSESTSNTSSGDFSDVCVNTVTEEDKPCDQKETMDEDILQQNLGNSVKSVKNENIPTTSFISLDKESLTTILSNQVSSSVKTFKSKEDFTPKTTFDSTQLTPPPTPENSSPKNEETHDENQPKVVLFDYTKIPNVLTSKETMSPHLHTVFANRVTIDQKSNGNHGEQSVHCGENRISVAETKRSVSQKKGTIEKKKIVEETNVYKEPSEGDRDMSTKMENLSKIIKGDVYQDQKYERYGPVVNQVQNAIKEREEKKRSNTIHQKLQSNIQKINTAKDDCDTEHLTNIETESESVDQSDTKCKKSSSSQDLNKNCTTQSNTKEHIIPIQIDSRNSDSNKEEIKNFAPRNNPKEHIIPIQISSRNSDSNADKSKTAKIIVVPIKSESQQHGIIPSLASKEKREHVIPIQQEKELSHFKENESNQTKTEEGVAEYFIPIKVESESEAKIQDNSNQTKTNDTDESISPTPSESSSSSETTSISTAKYIPTASFEDVSSLTKDVEDPSMGNCEPQTLRNLVLNRLLDLPFGIEVLNELAEVSKKIDDYTSKLTFKGLSYHIPAFIQKSEPNLNNFSEKKSFKMPETVVHSKESRLNKIEEENRKLYQLQQNFYLRKNGAYVRNKNVDTNERYANRDIEVTCPNRLLSIIREEPSESGRKANPNNYLYDENYSQERLKAQNLNEWLSLARDRSKSTSNLSNTDYSINNFTRNESNSNSTRRRSLPQELCEKQLRTIMEKEMEIQRELEWLEEEKKKIQAELAPSNQKFKVDDFKVSKKGDFAERKEKARPNSMPVIPTEFFRQQMYEEYLDKFSERQERKQQKVLKISSSNDLTEIEKQIKPKEVIHPIEIEQEFMSRVKEKLKKRDSENADKETNEKEWKSRDAKQEDFPPIMVLDGANVKSADTLPKHLQEILDDLTATSEDDSIWSPGQRTQPSQTNLKNYQRTDSRESHNNEPITPVWTPKSASSSPTVERKEFRSVSFQSPVLNRRNRTYSETAQTPDSTCSEPPWKLNEGHSQSDFHSSSKDFQWSSSLDRRIPTSQSTPGFGSFNPSPRLPRVQNPTITLLQKAREGQLPRGAHYIEPVRPDPLERKVVPKPRVPVRLSGDYHIKSDYESDCERPSRMNDSRPTKFEGVGPVTNDGMPLILRSEIKEKDHSKWYKKMYDTIHKQKPARDEYVTIRYKQKRAQYPYSSGYLSEPEPGSYDSDFSEYRYQTLDRRRTPQAQYYYDTSTMPRTNYVPDKSYSSSDIVKNTQEKYDNKPGRIENYTPGKSSISDKEAKRWWDEVMDIFDGHLEQQKRVPSFSQPYNPKSFMNQALKESGYESDSTLVFRRKEDTANLISPKEQKQAYKAIQQGGDVPFQGLRKPAPEKPKDQPVLQDLSQAANLGVPAQTQTQTPVAPPPPPPPPPKSHQEGVLGSLSQESPRRYVENQVNIHYKTPVRQEIKEYVSEDELAHRQAETMKKIYEEERRRKYLQELQDMKSRRHTDNFIPSQKSPISLNRYDDFEELTPTTKTRPKSPEPRLVARALYNFVGHTSRELTFRKGDLIYVRRQIDKNWYEGELNAMVGLFPTNYVEIVPYEGVRTTPRKAHEGQARAKYNFVAQTHLELSLAKGELVTITRRIDDNWFEGKIGGRKGIFPVAYVEVLIDPSEPPPPSGKPVAAPAAHSLLLNGSSQGKDSMGSHHYTPIPTTPHPPSYHAKPVQLTGNGTYSTLPKPSSKSPISQELRIDTQSDPVAYRALYKYTPQNDDELELLENDIVFVLEKCDDGWFVGSSDRTGAFGTFPGNYVEKVNS